MKNGVLCAALGAALAMASMSGSASAQDLADQAIGVWLRESKGWHVEFALCGDKLCGEVISGDGVDKGTGQSVIGVKMLYDLVKSDATTWVGRMYNPGDGNEYKGKVEVLSENEIKMSGCLLGGLICRSEKWPRIDAPAIEKPAAEEAPTE